MLNQLLSGSNFQEHIALWRHQVSDMKFESQELENPNRHSRAKQKIYGKCPDGLYERVIDRWTMVRKKKIDVEVFDYELFHKRIV